MIFAIQQGLAANLLARKYPVRVTVGYEEPLLSGAFRSRHLVHLKRPDLVGDGFVSYGRAAHFVRMCGYSARIYAAAPKPGALYHEHLAELELVVDGVLVALQKWSVSQRSKLEVVGGDMLKADDLRTTDASPPCMGYELRFRMARGVYSDRDYDGTLDPTGEIYQVVTAASVSLDGTYEDI